MLSAQGPEFYLQRLRPRLGRALLPPNSPVTDVPETPSPPPGPEMADHVAPPVVQATRLDLAVAPFDGQKRNFRTFLRSLRLLFMANPVVYATDLAKVLFALSKITGEGFAAEWANMKAEEILGNGKAGTWAEFVEELKRAFDDLNDRATALAGIASLKQGALAAPEFFAKFETLFRQAEMDEVGDSDILVHWLELNLNRRLVGRIYGVSPMPETYVQWKALAERLDAQQRRFDGVIAQQNSVRPVLPTTNRPPFPQTHFAPAALPHAPASAPCPFLAQPLARTPAPPSMPRPTNASDAMVWIALMPLEWCAPVSNVARWATWSESAPSQTRACRSRGCRSALWKAKVIVLKTTRMRLHCSGTAWSCTRERERLLLRSRILEMRPSESELAPWV